MNSCLSAPPPRRYLRRRRPGPPRLPRRPRPRRRCRRRCRPAPRSRRRTRRCRRLRRTRAGPACPAGPAVTEQARGPAVTAVLAGSRRPGCAVAAVAPQNPAIAAVATRRGRAPWCRMPTSGRPAAASVGALTAASAACNGEALAASAAAYAPPALPPRCAGPARTRSETPPPGRSAPETAGRARQARAAMAAETSSDPAASSAVVGGRGQLNWPCSVTNRPPPNPTLPPPAFLVPQSNTPCRESSRAMGGVAAVVRYCNFARFQAGAKPYTWPSLVAVTTRRSLATDTPIG